MDLTSIALAVMLVAVGLALQYWIIRLGVRDALRDHSRVDAVSDPPGDSRSDAGDG